MVSKNIIKLYAKSCLAHAAELEKHPGNTLEAEFQRTRARAAAEILEMQLAWTLLDPNEFIKQSAEIYKELLGEEY